MEDDYAALIANSFTNPLTFGGLSAAEVLAGQSNQNANSIISLEMQCLEEGYQIMVHS